MGGAGSQDSRSLRSSTVNAVGLHGDPRGQAGEYLKVIATRYGTTVNVLVQLNGIKNPNRSIPASA